MSESVVWLSVVVCVCMLAGVASAQEAPSASIPLWPDAPPKSSPDDSFRPYIEPFLVDTAEPRGAVLVCPGGGYGNRAEHEGVPIAQRLNEAGLHAFVVQYRVAPNRHPAPISDAARALRIVRYNAEKWKVKPDHIAILGFSAGGHLTASLGIHYASVEPLVDDTIEKISCRPDAFIPCYPVISSGDFVHRGSFDNLLGPDASQEMLDFMSLEKHVTKDTPPAFLWHTASDEGVPVENSLLLALALAKNDVPFELHVYPNGRHGLGLAPEDPHVATWMNLCCEWLIGMGW